MGEAVWAQVWSAEDTALNRLVAVKLLNPSSAAAPPAMRDGTAGYVLLTAEKATAP